MTKTFHSRPPHSALKTDCTVSYTPDANPLKIEVQSKVKPLFADAINALVENTLSQLSVETGKVHIDDFGALPFVMMAHLETVVKCAHPHIKAEVLPAFKIHAQYPSERSRLRRSRLYLPGNQPKLFTNAGIHQPDGVILDLEDSVPPDQKDLGRVIVRNALRVLDFFGAERMVRINQGELGLQDLEVILPHNVHTILIPKAETQDQLHAVNQTIDRVLKEHKLDHDVFLIPIIESALGILNAKEIAFASERNVGLSIGLEDYTADIGTQRTPEQKESLFARNMVLHAARAAGLAPLNSVYSDVADELGLIQYIRETCKMGFEGIGCIHPRQIKPVHQGFTPSPVEIEKAKQIIIAAETAEAMGVGVIAIGSKMIDPPVVKRAEQTIRKAVAGKVLAQNWQSIE